MKNIKKKKISVWLIAILIIIALVVLFFSRVASKKKESLEQSVIQPIEQTGIPANMSISEEVGG